MKCKLLITHIVALLLVFIGYAQTTATIGTGAVAGGTNDNGAPIYRSGATSAFDYSQSVLLYTQADLNGAGIYNGAVISSIAFNKTSTGGMTAGATASLNIFMQNTTNASLATTDNFANLTTGFTQVYANGALDNTVIPATAGYVVFPLSTPFTYTGGSIEIGLDWNVSTFVGNPSTGSFNWAHDVVPSVQARGNSNSIPVVDLSAAFARRYQAQMVFTGGAVCTAPPAGGQAVTSNSIACTGQIVSLSVTGDAIGAGSTFQWQYSVDNTTYADITGATLPTYNVPHAPAVNGFYQRIETCSGQTGTSTPVQVSPFTVPFGQTETFASYLPACWIESAGPLTANTSFTSTTASNWIADGFTNVGTTGAARVTISGTTTDEWLISPTYALTGGERLRFELALTDSANSNAISTDPNGTTGTDDSFNVVISTDDGVTWSSANTLRRWDNAGSANIFNNIATAGETVIIDLSAFTGNVKIGFYAESTITNAANDLFIDNVTVETIPTCLDVTAATFVSATSTTANFTWESNNASTSGRFEYIVDSMNSFPGGPDATSTPTGTFPVGNSSATTPVAQAGVITGLNPATTYNAYIREVCAVGDSSPWTSAVSFTTACVPVAVFSENFDAVSTPSLPVCWSSFATTITGTTQPSVITSTAADNSLPNGVSLQSGSADGSTIPADVLLISPVLSNLSAGTHRVRFFLDANVSTSSVEVGTITDPNNPATFTAITTIPATTSWVEHIVNFNTYSGTDTYLAFRHVFTTTSDNLYLDDIIWQPIPSCIAPTSLAVTGSTATTVDLSWVNANSSTVSSVEYGAPNFVPGAGTTVAGLGNTASITGLMPATSYDFYVTQDCTAAGDGLSVTTGPIRAVTACNTFTTPFFQDFENFNDTTNSTISDPCWSTSPAGSTTAVRWDVQNGVGGTPSVTSGPTGPAGAFDGDAFMYLETSAGAQGDFADLRSPIIDLSNLTNPALSFKYHMYGATMGSLDVLVDDGTNPPAIIFTVTGQQQTANTQPWLDALIPLTAYANGTITVIFRATRGSNFTGDVSIDAVSIDEAPACINVSGVTAGSITATSASISWTENNTPAATAWEVIVQAAGTAAPTPGATNATTNPFVVSTLASNTAYDVYVRTNCATTFAAPISFSTPCAAFNAPYTVDFDTFTPSTSFASENCWDEISTGAYTWDVDGGGSTSSSGTGPSGANSGTNYFFTEATPAAFGDVAVLRTPLVNLTALTNPALTFYTHLFGDSIGTFEVFAIAGGTATSVFSVTGQQQPTEASPWDLRIVNLSAFAGQTIQIEFRHTVLDNGNGGFAFEADAALDDVAFGELPTCVQPSMLNATAITATSAQLGWTTGGSGETAWDVEVVTAGTAPTGTPTNAGVANPFTVMSLMPDTAYDYYVRAACSATDFSSYSGPFSFRTLCAPVTTFPVTTDFTNNVPNSCWSQAGDGELAAGPSGFGTSDWRQGRGYTNLSGTAVPSNALNLWQSVDREWLISETYDLSGGAYNLAVEVAVTNYTFSGTSTATDTDTMGSDDSVILAITTDSGVTWTPLTTWNVGNQPATTGTEFFADLTAFTGLVQFAFLGSDGTVDNTEDYDFHVGSFRIETTAGVNDSNLAASLKLYPNPVNGDELNISFSQNVQGTVHVTIVNMTGQVVRTARFDQVSNAVQLNDMTRLAAGVYFVNVTQGTQAATLKFIKQ